MDTPSIFDLTISDWAFIAVFCGTALGALFVMGMYVCQLYIQIFRRNRMATYREWGAESDLMVPSFLWMLVGPYYLILEMALRKLLSFLGINNRLPRRSRENRISLMRSGPSWWIVVDSTFVTSCSAYAIWIVAILIDVLVNDYGVNDVINKVAISVAIIVFMIGLAREFIRTEKIITKIDRLDNLGPRFHQLFTKSELLSMYEALQFAPSTFWNEYSALEKWEINRATNRKFRDMAAPYQYSNTRNIAKAALITSTIALIVALIVAGIEQSSVFRDLLLRLLQ